MRRYELNITSDLVEDDLNKISFEALISEIKHATATSPDLFDASGDHLFRLWEMDFLRGDRTRGREYFDLTLQAKTGRGDKFKERSVIRVVMILLSFFLLSFSSLIFFDDSSYRTMQSSPERFATSSYQIQSSKQSSSSSSRTSFSPPLRRALFSCKRKLK